MNFVNRLLDFFFDNVAPLMLLLALIIALGAMALLGITALRSWSGL